MMTHIGTGVQNMMVIGGGDNYKDKSVIYFPPEKWNVESGSLRIGLFLAKLVKDSKIQ